MTEKEIREMPKVDLHCHLDGSLSKECLSRLLNREVSREELQVKDGCESLAEYLEKFDLPLKCLQDEEGLKQAGADFIKNVAEDHVKYVEVRFAPLLSTDRGLDCEHVMGAVLEGLEQGKKEWGVEYNVIACAMRHHTYEQNLRMIDEVKGFYGKGLCAADLAGNEAAFPMEQFKELFSRIYDLGIPFTIHAGECGRVENIIESVKLGAKRIGHGIALSGNPEAIAFVKEHKTGIEMCPVSNLQTKAVKRAEDYPIREFLDAGLAVTLNTDNRTVSNTTLTKEIRFVQQYCGVTDHEIRQIMRQGIEVSFAQEETKNI